MTVPTIRQTAPWPLRNNGDEDYSQKADAVGATLPLTIDDMNVAVDFTNQRAIDADASAQAAAESELAVEADRLVVVTRADEVASNTATVVDRADEVAINAQQVAANTQQVAQDAQAVADALASVADGPVTSVNGMTGAVTGLLSEQGRQAVQSYTLASAATTETLDLAVSQVFRVDASAPRTLAFANEPGADRAMTVVIHLAGSSGVMWPASIVWDSGAVPVLGAAFTRVVLFWDGVQWTGAKEIKR